MIVLNKEEVKTFILKKLKKKNRSYQKLFDKANTSEDIFNICLLELESDSFINSKMKNEIKKFKIVKNKKRKILKKVNKLESKLFELKKAL